MKKIETIFIDAEQDGRTYAQIIGKPEWSTVATCFAIALFVIGILIVNLLPVP